MLSRILAASALIAAGLGTAAAPAAATSAPSTRALCATPVHPGDRVCFAVARTGIAQPRALRDSVRPYATPSGYSPTDLRSAYNLPSTTNGSGALVAIVDAYGDPNLESDLAVYRSEYGLPSCTTANGCFHKLNQNGQASPLPANDSGWAGETALDVDMVSAVCPLCRIDVLEANTAGGDLDTAVNTAVSLGAKFISLSWGGGEYSGETGQDSTFNHPGVAITASSGDGAYGVSYPAASPYVVAVGGTSLTRSTTSRGWSESAWSGAGSGCSAYEPKPSWQHDGGCGRRTVADVSAVADPGTGVAFYTTYGGGGWGVVGGTSVASPIVAATYALAGSPSTSAQANSYPYAHTSALWDAVGGSNGSCGTYLCNGVTGYDGPTGLGTPNGVSAFSGSGPATITDPAGKCIDVSGDDTGGAGTPVQLWDCQSYAVDQHWTYTNNTLQTLGRCMDIQSGGTSDGTKVQLWDCNGTGAQTWQHRSDGSLYNPQSGKCLDDPNSNTSNGVQLQIWDCNQTNAQKWASAQFG